MSMCYGVREGSSSSKCGYNLFHCKKCKNVGCSYDNTIKCSNQLFRNGRCLRCGSVGTKEYWHG